MLTHEQIARAFLREAQSDLNSARVPFTAGEHARCIAHAQHTVEKTLKSVLAARGTVITGRHQVSFDFGSLCADVPDVTRITRIAARLENIGTRAEYPIWIPSDRLGQADSEQGLNDGAYVFTTLSGYLSSQHGIRL